MSKYKYNYTLIDENDNNYKLNMEFYGKYNPQINGVIYVDDSILKEVNLYAFDEVYYINNIDIKEL